MMNKDEKILSQETEGKPLTQAVLTSDEVRPLWFWQRPQATARGQIETKMVLMNVKAKVAQDVSGMEECLKARAEDQNQIKFSHTATCFVNNFDHPDL